MIWLDLVTSIVVVRSEQRLYATLESGEQVEFVVSTGLSKHSAQSPLSLDDVTGWHICHTARRAAARPLRAAARLRPLLIYLVLRSGRPPLYAADESCSDPAFAAYFGLCRPLLLSCDFRSALSWRSAPWEGGDGDITHLLCPQRGTGRVGGAAHNCRRAAYAVAAAETGRPPLRSQRLGGRGPQPVTSSSRARCRPPAARAPPPELAPSRACAVSN